MWRDIAGATAAVLLAGIGVLHLVWTVSPWPARSQEELARHVYGRGTVMPSATACAVVGVGLLAAAYGVLGRAGLAPDLGLPVLFRLGTWLLAGVLLLRGAAGPLLDRSADPAFARLDRIAYSPLCVALGLCTLAVATG
ncbi:DUF3995 domain-containing protein [Kitasatospora sp. NPDC056446]|uniref:DUF3995 domain-containing protein n=1 Tax=Kitasatospora sp. NPDC056446 TaxID=3345819 RepID=UPI0036A04DD8